MKRTVIITAKMRDEYYRLIEEGIKQYEVRSESFSDAQIIHYVSATSGRSLGMYTLVDTFPLPRQNEQQLRKYAAIPSSDFDAIFPLPDCGGAPVLWVARLGAKIQLSTVIGG